MEIPKVVFRGEGNSKIGLGHLSRLGSIAAHLKTKFHRILVINKFTRELDNITSGNFEEIVELGFEETELYSSKEIDSYYRLADIIVADGYSFNSEYQKEIKSKNKKLVYVDDLASFEQYADVVINHALGIDPGKYKIQSYTKLCLGPRFLMLREEFISGSVQFEPGRNRVLVCFGGADPQNYSQKIIDFLSPVKGLRMDIIIGPTNKNFEKNYAGSNLVFHKNLGAAEIVDLIRSSGVMICSASTIAYEACCVGIPLLIVKTANNQDMIAKGLVENNCAIELKPEELLKTEDIIKLVADLQLNSGLVMSQAAVFKTSVKNNFLEIFVNL